MVSHALPSGSRILVTGANGYIASHVVDQLLGLGYLVRGTIRTPRPWLNEYFEEKHGKGFFETVIIPSFEDVRILKSLFEGVDGIVHLASDLTFSSDPQEVIPWVIKAMLSILEVAAKTPTIKRVVLASSSSASYMLFPNPEGREVDENTWNDEAVRAAWDSNTPEDKKGVSVYAASKTESERQSWKWIEEHKPKFEFNTVLPCFNVGRILHPNIPGSTMGWTRKLLEGNETAFTNFPEQWYVDVEDVARLCVIGLLDETVKSERIFAFGEQTNWADVIAILRELRPNNKLIPNPPRDLARDVTKIIPRKRAEELLRSFYGKPGFMTVKDSIANGIEGYE